MSIPSSTFPALTTVFTPSPFCSDRYAVFIGTPTPVGGIPSTNNPSSGWIDPSFSTCNPPQYTNAYPTFSPGVCPSGMTIVASSSSADGTKTVWTGACCESGFSQMDAQYLCTSTVTTSMAFLLDPNISTTDVYTTLSSIYIEHDQLAVLWEETDLPAFPTEVAAQYASIMNVAVPTPNTPVTDDITTTAMQSPAASIIPESILSTAPSQASSQSSKKAMTSTLETADNPATPQSFVALSSASLPQIHLWLCWILLLSSWT
ncbi:hypothetical protein KJ359_000532 [Pestalotiopsis sp. 9143b]|nr:hypothetical protein KJ359_000532 [Pestalotiopsis sp. 9143b]